MPGHFNSQTGLASIYRQRNPYDRKVEATATMIPKSGYAAPFLAAVMGRDVTAAGEWDSERAQSIGKAMEGGMAAQKDENDKKFAMDFLGKVIDASKTSTGFANGMWQGEVMDNPNPNPYLARMKNANLEFVEKTNKDDWGQVKLLNAQGEEEIYQVNWKIFFGDIQKGGMPAALETKSAVKLGISKEAQKPTTREVQRGNLKITEEFDAQTNTWKEVGKGPQWEEKGKEGSVEDIDKEFRQWTNNLDSLYGRKASIQKGYDPITGAVIPQTQIADALRSVDPQITQTETYMAEKFPQQWGIYKSTKGRLIHPVDAGTVNTGVFKSPDRIVASPTTSPAITPAEKSSTSGTGEKTGIKYLEREAVLDMLGAGYRVKQDKDGRKYVYDKKGNKVGETK